MKGEKALSTTGQTMHQLHFDERYAGTDDCSRTNSFERRDYKLTPVGVQGKLTKLQRKKVVCSLFLEQQSLRCLPILPVM